MNEYEILDEALEYLNTGQLPEYIIEGEDKEVKQLMKKWRTSDQSSIKKTFSNTSLSNNDYQMLMTTYHTMRSADNYKEYKEAFDRLCNFCHIVPKGTIITKCEIKSGTNPHNSSIFVEYAYNTKKIRLPEGMKLYHLSKIPDIKELIPVFRGKSVKGYMYDAPRVYFTIHKEMPKFLADYHWYERIHKYECKSDIKEFYVDPLVPIGRIQGALYVVTDKAIPVEEMGIKKK